MNPKLEAALAYGRMRWKIFPCHSIINGRCSCSNDPAVICRSTPPSPGKHPRIKGGFKAASDDEAQIRRWWTKWPDANIALATGSGLAVFDIDGEAGAAEFKTLVAEHGAVPETLTAATGRGFHLIFAAADGPEVRSSARGNVHVRGEGGYIIVAPSQHISGKTYSWVRNVKTALLPDWLRQWSQGYDISNKTVGRQGFAHLGALPSHLSGQISLNERDISQKLEDNLRPVWTAAEQARLISALQAIDVKACGYEDFLRIGMALKELGWERSNGTDIGFSLWDEWCSRSEHHNQAGLKFKWKSFKRSGVSVGTVYHLARQHGWNGGVPEPAARPPSTATPEPYKNGHPADTALPAAFLTAPQAIFFPDVTETGKARPTCTNAAVAIAALGISCRKDLFHEKTLVGGEPINRWVGDLSDEVIQMIRKIIRYKFGFDPNKVNTADACVQLSLEHQFDPVLDYLDSLAWDGVSRLDSWLVRYLGAADTELIRTIGRLILIAAVRRARVPGTKFDQIMVLEGPEGKGKSLAIETLAGRDNFSDGKILGLGDREQQEATAGVWLYEIAELTGMRKAEIEHVKAFASRTVDRARPAYGRFRVDRPRRTIFIATTNRDDYLQSDTGNRRFWPVATARIDLAALKADRDQLWAEAAACEARGDSIGLPERLWEAASERQGERLEGDEWFELIARWCAEKKKRDVSVTEVLCDNQYIQRKPDGVTRGDAIRAGVILKRLRYQRYHQRVAGGFVWRYRLLAR